jgi:Flp pilus assembly protein TadG
MMRRRLRRRRGQSLVELALITPLLLALVGGGVDLARIYFAGNEVSDAAREAGLYATNHAGYSQANLQTVVDGSTGGSGFACQSPTVQPLTSPSPLPTTSGGGTPFEQTVKVTCSMSLILKFLPVPNPVQMSSVVNVYVCPTPTPASPSPTPRPC